jgi:threonine dehydrogenase-like Zn-dependent dehydrogenase
LGQIVKAITVLPGTPSSVQLDERPEPTADATTLLVQALALGVCGTDREIISGSYGWAPPGKTRLILGHESLGRVIDAPRGCGFAIGDHVVGIVRRPDPVPCVACAQGEWDMCRNGQYAERGINSLDGYGAERFPLETGYAVKVDRSLGTLGVLLEPASILAKGWDHIDRIGHRTRGWSPRTVLVTGGGSIGFLAALMARQRGLDIHLLDRAESGLKPELVRDLGGTYHVRTLPDGFAADIIFECTGALAVISDVMMRAAPNGIVCLTGISTGGERLPFDLGGFNRNSVLGNIVTFGTVNANRAHYELGAQALADADRQWLSRLITRRVPLDRWQEAFQRRPGEIKVILEFEKETT